MCASKRTRLLQYLYLILIFYRTEQTASLKVDNGHIITGASPGKLRQLNGNGQLFIGTFTIHFKTVFECWGRVRGFVAALFWSYYQNAWQYLYCPNCVIIKCVKILSIRFFFNFVSYNLSVSLFKPKEQKLRKHKKLRKYLNYCNIKFQKGYK